MPNFRFCSLYSGSSGNSLFVGSDRTCLLMDAGVSAKKICAALGFIGENPSSINALLISHEHSDHIKGAGILSRRFNIPIYINSSAWQFVKEEIGPVGNIEFRFFETGSLFTINDIEVLAFPTPHDAAEPVGFCFFSHNRKISIASDIGHLNGTLLDMLAGSDLVFIEANHDVEMLKAGKYPYWLKRRILGDFGHLSNECAGEAVSYLAGKGTRKFVLGHLSKENNFPELAMQTVCNALTCKGLKVGSSERAEFTELALDKDEYKDNDNIQLKIAPRDFEGGRPCFA